MGTLKEWYYFCISSKFPSLEGKRRTFNFANTYQNMVYLQIVVLNVGAMGMITLLSYTYTSENWYLKSDTNKINFLNIFYLHPNFFLKYCFTFSLVTSSKFEVGFYQKVKEFLIFWINIQNFMSLSNVLWHCKV